MNKLTNLGVAGKDKNVASEIEYEPLAQRDAESMFAADPIAAKQVTMIAEDMVREGFDIKVADWTEEQTQDFMKYLDNTLNWKPLFMQALVNARLHGGSALMPVVNDGASSLSMPLNATSINGMKYVTEFTRWELSYQDIQSDPMQPGYGLPLTYMLTPDGVGTGNVENMQDTSIRNRRSQNTGRPITVSAAESRNPIALSGVTIHASRLIRFDGETLPRQLFIENGYWHDSILNKRWNSIRNYGIGQESASVLITDFAQPVFKIENLHEIMSSEDGEALLKSRIDLVDYCRSVLRSVIIGKEEEFERKATPVTGLPELLDRQEKRMVASSEYPHNVLLGEAPGASLGEAGQAQMRVYYDRVSNCQETKLKPQLVQFLKLVFADKSGPTKGVEPKDWSIEFKPLYQEPQSVILANQKIQAEIDNMNIMNGILTAEEVAQSRYGSGEYSFETKLVYDRALEEGAPLPVDEPTEPEPDPSEPDPTTGEGEKKAA